jgi:hypothetical protein
MAVLYTFREPSLCRQVHREFMRSAVLDVTARIPATACHQRNYVESVVVKYMGDTFLDLSCEKPPGHPDKKYSPVPPEGPKRECLSAGRVESVAV